MLRRAWVWIAGYVVVFPLIVGYFIFRFAFLLAVMVVVGPLSFIVGLFGGDLLPGVDAVIEAVDRRAWAVYGLIERGLGIAGAS